MKGTNATLETIFVKEFEETDDMYTIAFWSNKSKNNQLFNLYRVLKYRIDAFYIPKQE